MGIINFVRFSGDNSIVIVYSFFIKNQEKE